MDVEGEAVAVGAPVNAEQAWQDLQRIRVPQERVYDEVERSASGGPRTTYGTAGLMWLFLAAQGLEPPPWGVALAAVAYLSLLAWMVVTHTNRSRVRLHHSRYDWRSLATFAGGAVLVGGVTVLTGRLAQPLEPLAGSVIQATAAAAVFVVFVGPANRWATGTLRGRGAGAEAGR
ncbi:hypothetical protein ACGF3J_09830 [Streptomyces sp. NPDC048171]|uniref:hypothetical protein n=1 Tax=unclassified Streptomyces TaxID=2593676 RepID=UPI0031FEA2EB